MYFPVFQGSFKKFLFRFKDNMPPKEVLLMELETVKNYVEGKHFALVMCHNDVWGRNIIYNPPGLLKFQLPESQLFVSTLISRHDVIILVIFFVKMKLDEN